MTAANRAAIDIGTNSIHLLVAAVGDEGEFTVLTTEKETVRLGESAGDFTRLGDEAIERGVKALRRFRAIADSFDASVEAVATSAVREAANGPEFVTRVRDEAGIDIDVISGVEEARLIQLGILQALPIFDQQLLMVDIGGGSTELLVGKSGRTLVARSLKLGHLRLTNRFFDSGEVDAAAVADCREFVRAFLVPAVNDLRPLGYQVAVGSSGTIETLGALVRRRATGEVGAAGLDTVIGTWGLAEVLDELVAHPTAALRAKSIAGLDERRADVIVAGAVLLDEIFRAFEIDRMLTSPYALREGVLLDRSSGIEGGSARLADLRRDSLVRMADAFEEDRSHVEHATDLAVRIFDELTELHGLGQHERELLWAAGLLHNVGLFVSHAAHHQHSEYVIRNSDRLVGYTEREIELIAQVARYHRRSAPKPSHERFTALDAEDQRRVRWMAGALRIGIALDRTRQTIVEDLRVHHDGAAIRIECRTAPGADPSVEIFQANSRSALLASVSGRAVTVD